MIETSLPMRPLRAVTAPLRVLTRSLAGPWTSFTVAFWAVMKSGRLRQIIEVNGRCLRLTQRISRGNELGLEARKDGSDTLRSISTGDETTGDVREGEAALDGADDASHGRGIDWEVERAGGRRGGLCCVDRCGCVLTLSRSPGHTSQAHVRLSQDNAHAPALSSTAQKSHSAPHGPALCRRR